MENTINTGLLAKSIIVNNQYFTLATCDKNSNPWACVAAYTFDTHYNFYFISKPNSQHIKNIKINKKGVIAIYDSTQQFGEGVGLQIDGDCVAVNIVQLPKVIKLYLGRKWLNGSPTDFSIINSFISKKIFLFYKFTPKNFYMIDPNSDNEVRIKVFPSK